MESFSGERVDAKRFLEGVESGSLSAGNAFELTENMDEILTYFLIRFLREKYRPGTQGSEGVVQRLIELTGTYPSIVKACKDGEKDPMTEWFDDTYELRSWLGNADGYVDLIVDKLDS